MNEELPPDLMKLLMKLDPLRERDLERALALGAARGGAEAITAVRWRRAHGRRVSQSIGRMRSGAIGLAGMITSLGVVMLALWIGSSSSPPASALSFSESKGYVIARIVNPYASVRELRRELAANRLDIELKLMPVSPGAVGSVIAFDVNGSPSNGIEPLQEGQCVNGPCTVGLKVARDFRGSGHIYIGRPARRGERYLSTPIGGAFASGEPLHCSGLQGAAVERVLPVLRHKKMRVVGWRVMGSGTWPKSRELPLRAHVQEVMPVAPGEVELWVGSGPAVLHEILMKGCGTT